MLPAPPADLTLNQDDPLHRRWRLLGGALERAHASRLALLQPALAQLQRFETLRRGWDGYHGLPVRPKAAVLARVLLSVLVHDDGPTPQLTPIGDGGVQMEWRVSGSMLEIEASAEGTLRFFARRGDGVVSIDDEELPPELASRHIVAAASLLQEMSGDVAHRRPRGE